MKKFKFILPLLAMFLVSGTVFGQLSISTFVQDYSESITISSLEVIVKVEWYGSNGQILSEKQATTAIGISQGITISAPSSQASRNFFPILSTKVWVVFTNTETHYAIYPGHALQAIRANDPQYWIVTFP